MMFPFIGREKELENIKATFRKVLKYKTSSAYLLQGRLGIGKTRLITEFIENIERDLTLYSEVPNFNSQKHVITYKCKKEDGPYSSFFAVTNEIIRRKKLLNIFNKTVQFFLAIFGINDALNALKELAVSINEGAKKEIVLKKEVELFNKYRKLLKKISQKTPLLIYFENIQWIDSYSLTLIEKILYDEKAFWGLIFLEEDE